MMDNKNLYQLGTCSSTYKNDNEVLITHTNDDLGHTEHQNQCKMKIQDPNGDVTLPRMEFINMKEILDKQTTQYLWNNLGAVLSKALLEVAELQPKNPMHCLAHKLLYYKYNRSTKEFEKSNREAQEYKAIILQERKDKAAAALHMWKEKQVKRRKPEESDDTQETYAFTSTTAQQLLLTLLEY